MLRFGMPQQGSKKQHLKILHQHCIMETFLCLWAVVPHKN